MSKILNFNAMVVAILVVAVLVWAVYIPGRNAPREVSAQETPVAASAGAHVAHANTATNNAANSAAANTTNASAGANTTDVSMEVAQRVPQLIEFTLRTQTGGEPPMAFVGVGGDIDGVVNPELVANVGDTIRLTVMNGEPVLHDLVINEFGVASGNLTTAGQSVTMEFVVDRPGQFVYYCSVPGHKEVGMQGILRVEGEGSADMGYGATAHTPSEPVVITAPAVESAVSVVRNPADLPLPVGNREAQTLRIDMTAIEVDGVLADGTTFRYMTFDGQVPGPMLRVRVGDTVELHLKNDESSFLPHSIDLHAVTGPGGGAVFTQNLPGVESMFTFKALQPGLYVYHCATASIPHHISSGMYGLILVEPEGGLPPVDREFYVMQGEIYTTQPYGTKGHLDFSAAQMADEQPEYFIFNGAAAALTTEEHVMKTEVGDSVRIFFGVGGPNFTSSLHLIGEIFDRVYDQGSTSAPLTDVQTTLVPAGGATMVEFTMDVPGQYVLVDHALSRLERGLVAHLVAEGEDHPEIFHGEGEANMAGH